MFSFFVLQNREFKDHTCEIKFNSCFIILIVIFELIRI